MGLRMVEMVISRDAGDDLADISKLDVLGVWKGPLDDDLILVRVMVAVALPPLVTAGLLAGHGDWELAGRAALLLATNLICVNLAAVATFLWQGVRPSQWWEAKRAKRIVVYAALVWLVLLTLLIGLIVYAGKK